jgi:hypothetical protein
MAAAGAVAVVVVAVLGVLVLMLGRVGAVDVGAERRVAV